MIQQRKEVIPTFICPVAGSASTCLETELPCPLLQQGIPWLRGPTGKKIISLITAPKPRDGLHWRALTCTHCFPSSHGPNPTRPRNPKINNSSQGMLPCCCHCQDLVHTSLMLLLLPQEKLQIDPQDLTPGSHTSPGLPLLLLSISNG